MKLQCCWSSPYFVIWCLGLMLRTLYSGWEKSLWPIGDNESHSRVISELGSLPEKIFLTVWQMISSLTALNLHGAVLCIMRKSLQIHVTENQGFHPVVILHISRPPDLNMSGVSCGGHDWAVSTILYEQIRSPDEAAEVVFSLYLLNISEMWEL